MRPLGQVEPGGADRVPDTVGVEGVAHHRVPDPVAAADAAGVADHDHLGPVELDAGRAGRDRGVERRGRAARRRPTASRSRRARPRCRAPCSRWTGPSTRACSRSRHVVPAALGVADGVDGQQRRLGLHVVHVGRVGDPGPLHRDLDRGGDLRDHRAAGRCPPAAAARSSRSPTVSRGSSVGTTVVPRGTVAKIVACGLITPSVPPDHTIGICVDLGRPAPLRDQHLAERAVGDDPRVVVDAAVALGLADHGDDPVGVDHAVVDQPRRARTRRTRCAAGPCGPRWRSGTGSLLGVLITDASVWRTGRGHRRCRAAPGQRRPSIAGQVRDDRPAARRPARTGRPRRPLVPCEPLREVPLLGVARAARPRSTAPSGRRPRACRSRQHGLWHVGGDDQDVGADAGGRAAPRRGPCR